MRKSLLELLSILLVSSVSADIIEGIDNESPEEAVRGVGSSISLGLGIGVQFGQHKGHWVRIGAPRAGSGEKKREDVDKFFGAFSLGYNHVVDKFIVGLGGTYSFSQKKVHQAINADDGNSLNFDIQPLRGTAEAYAKVGFINTPKSSFYVKGCAVWQKAKYINHDADYLWEGTQTKISPKIALGCEQKIIGDASVFAEYGYTFNTKKTYEKTDNANARTTHDELKREKGHSITVGVAYNMGLN